MAHSRETVEAALQLISGGLSDYEVSRQLGVHRSTIRYWRLKPDPLKGFRSSACVHCDGPGLDVITVHHEAYADLLGQYLGDGCVTSNSKWSYSLRVCSDAKYPGIIAEVCEAIETVRCPGPQALVRPHHEGNCVVICSHWKHWPCYFPQHGPGRKHHRKIELGAWEERERRPRQSARLAPEAQRGLSGGGGRAARPTKPKPLSVEAAVAEARRLLEQALGAIDGEVDAARAEIERYNELINSAKARKAELETKIKALG